MKTSSRSNWGRGQTNSSKGGGGEKPGDITLYTVGHSNRAADEFIGLLLKNRVEVLADIRKLPGSNKHPHLNRDELANSLSLAGISYVYLKELGYSPEAILATEPYQLLFAGRAGEAMMQTEATLVVTRSDVAALLGLAECIDAVEATFRL